MKNVVDGPRNATRKYVGGRSPVREVFVASAVVFLVVTMAACASSKGESADSWRGNYFMNPDRVWNAIELTLIDLEYEVIKENRPDGVIQAESSPDEDGTVILLAIDQMMRTEDQVNVFVKPVAGDPTAAPTQETLDKAAQEFTAVLKRKLGG